MDALNHKTIPALILPEATTVHAQRYSEIMANINREDLTKLERAEALSALKSTWEALNPSAKHGGDRRSAAVRAVKEREAEERGDAPRCLACFEGGIDG